MAQTQPRQRVFGSDQELSSFIAHRAVIDLVKGMLMIIYGTDEVGAFELLKKCSQDSNIKVRLIALQLKPTDENSRKHR